MSTDTIAASQLRAFVERIERLEAEIKEINADKSEIYKELRGCGFDVKAVRQCVAARKLDMAELQERNTIFDLYWEALTGASRVHVHEAANSKTQERPSINDEASLEAGPQAEASLAGTGSRTLADREGRSEGEAASADLPTNPDADVPAFLLKERKPLRPLCLNPSECAGYGTHTCHSCLKAAGKTEVAA